MGVSSSPQHLAAKLRAFASDLPDSGRRGVQAAGRVVQVQVDRQLLADVPSKGLRSGAKHGRSTARALTTRLDDMRRIPDNPAVFLSARGPWQVFNNPTKPHTIMSKAYRRDIGKALRSLSGQGGRFRRSRSTKSRVLAFNGRFAAHVQHPGTRGKDTWQKGVARGTPLAPKAFEREIAQSMGKVFR